MTRRRISINIDQLKEAVSRSISLREVLNILNRNTSSASYTLIKRRIVEFNIDCTHFLSKSELAKQTYLKNGRLPMALSNDEIFCVNNVGRSTVKNRLIDENLIEYKCNECDNIGEWMGQKITLILDHINGISNDNRLENLRFLCPNCNATLETHCVGKSGLDRKLSKIKKQREKLSYKPRLHLRKVVRPNYDDLILEIKQNGYSATGRKYGVSYAAIYKWVNDYKRLL